MPEVTPPAVMRLPSLTILAFSSGRSDERQQLGVAPMRGRAPPLQQASDAENECAGAHRGDVFRTRGLPPHEGDGFLVDHGAGDAGGAAGHADEVERRAVGEGRRRHEGKAAMPVICRTLPPREPC